MAKNKKKSSSAFTITVVIIVIFFILIAFKEAMGIGDSIFSPNTKNSNSVNEHIPPKLRWEKSFRFGDDEEKGKGGGNFLQYQTDKNKNK
ncbi:hypothetical protein [Malaciobacter canalis]|jgi:hypothetical protein|uniref:hypothetical protein n=1 Tax=Malaciobacter canalis TaxID=1912871 RepID=UPI0038508191